jgi:hypothetical protein
MADSKHPYNEAGCRLKAALISYQIGRKGVDSTLKQVPENPGEGWADLAQRLLYDMLNRAAKPFDPTSGGPIRIK